MWKILLLVLLLAQNCPGGFERTEMGARASAFGNAYVGLADDVWAIFYNSGGLARIKSYQVSFFYSPQPFGLSELSNGSVAAAAPFNFGSLGFALRKYGFELYRELTGTLSYANTFKGVHLGININYNSVTIKNYGSAGTVGIDAGLIVPVIQNFQWGIFIKNLNSPTIGISKEKLPQSFTTGVAYLPISNFTLLLDMEKEINFDLAGRFGFEYWLIDAVALRGGVSDVPTQFSGGVGIRYSLFQVDYAFTTHQELGSTHCFSITIQ